MRNRDCQVRFKRTETRSCTHNMSSSRPPPQPPSQTRRKIPEIIILSVCRARTNWFNPAFVSARSRPSNSTGACTTSRYMRQRIGKIYVYPSSRSFRVYYERSVISAKYTKSIRLVNYML